MRAILRVLRLTVLLLTCRLSKPQVDADDQADPYQDELAAALDAWRIKCRLRIEAGVILEDSEWAGWLTISQTIYLEEAERFRQIQRALDATFLASELRGGFLAENVIIDELDEHRQDEALLHQEDRKEAAEQRARVFGRAA